MQSIMTATMVTSQLRTRSRITHNGYYYAWYGSPPAQRNSLPHTGARNCRIDVFQVFPAIRHQNELSFPRNRMSFSSAPCTGTNENHATGTSSNSTFPVFTRPQLYRENLPHYESRALCRHPWLTQSRFPGDPGMLCVSSWTIIRKVACAAR